jgi:hypothetical protein
MTDVDRMLRDDAATWNNTSAVEPPSLESMIDIVFRDAARPRRLRRGLAMALSAAAVLAVGVAVWASHDTKRADSAQPSSRTHAAAAPAPTGAAPPGVASSVLDHGQALPYVGEVPWRDAVLDASDPSAVFIMADWDRMTARFRQCAKPVERLVVTDTSDTPSVLIAGYAAPFSGICATAGNPLQRIRVKMPRTGVTTLFDVATSTKHAVLDPTTAPRIIALPDGFAKASSEWDEQTGIVRASYSSASGGAIWIDRGTPAAIDGEGPLDGTLLITFDIGGATATIRSVPSLESHQFTIDWTTSANERFVTTVSVPNAQQPPSTRELEAMSRSVQ